MTIKLEDVFGVSSKPVLSYIERPAVDDRFKAALTSDRQIVVYGSSKQGKTALVSKYLPYNENITVSVTPKTEVTDIYRTILRKLDIKIERTSEDTKGRETGLTASLNFKAFIPIIGSAGTKVRTEAKSNLKKAQQFEEIPFNLALPQDVSELTKRVSEEIVVIVENFHYLDDDKQQQLAFDLRTFQELGVQFVILGVWREKNRLIQFNGDLLDRITEVPVEPWTEDEFREVAGKGATELNITIDDTVVERCVAASFSSIGVFQELIKETCLSAGVKMASPQNVNVANASLVDHAIAEKAVQYAARHQRALESIATGNLSTSSKEGVQPLFLPYYLVQTVLRAGYEAIATGMRRATIQDRIQGVHHRSSDVRASDMSNLLHNLAKLQSNKNISPPIIDYDRTSKMLQVVDSTFYFFLKHADLQTIADEIPNPLAESGDDNGMCEESQTSLF